jgi:hypothetical protein
MFSKVIAVGLITVLVSTVAACSSSPSGEAAAGSDLGAATPDGREGCRRVAEGLASGDWPSDPQKLEGASSDPLALSIQMALVVDRRDNFVLAKAIKPLLGCTIKSVTTPPGATETPTGNLCLVESDQGHFIIWDMDKPFVGPGGFQGAARLWGRLQGQGVTWLHTSDSENGGHFKVSIPMGIRPASDHVELVSVSSPFTPAEDPNRETFNWTADYSCAPVSNP